MAAFPVKNPLTLMVGTLDVELWLPSGCTESGFR